MIDASVDPDFAAFERQESFRGSAVVAEDRAGSADRVVCGRLTTLSPRAARPSEQAVEGVLAVPEPVPADPLGHLRAARFGFAAAVILVLYWLWIRERRKR